MDSYFEKGVHLKGTLWAKGIVHLDGDFEGEIYSTSHISLGKAAKILGNIKAHDVTSKGYIQGNLLAKNKVLLMNESSLIGDISAYHLIIGEGSKFNGNCKMIDGPIARAPKTMEEDLDTLEHPLAVADKEIKNLKPNKSKSNQIGYKLSKKNMGIAAAVLFFAWGIWYSL